MNFHPNNSLVATTNARLSWSYCKTTLKSRKKRLRHIKDISNRANKFSCFSTKISTVCHICINCHGRLCSLYIHTAYIHVAVNWVNGLGLISGSLPIIIIIIENRTLSTTNYRYNISIKRNKVRNGIKGNWGWVCEGACEKKRVADYASALLCFVFIVSDCRSCGSSSELSVGVNSFI